MALILFIKELPEGDSVQEFSCSADEFLLNYPEVETSGELKIAANITKLRDQVVVRGSFSITVKLSCARCTEEFERRVESDLIFVIRFVADQESELLEEEDSDDFYFLPEGTLEFDFSQVIRDRIILELEMKPLCSESCKGLCAQCGQNLNVEDCNCNKEIPDERWLPLKELTDRRK